MCIDLSDDYIDVRGITARVDELRGERDDLQDTLDTAENDAKRDRAHRELLDWAENEGSELTELESLLDDICGSSRAHQWEGSWYPAYLVADSAFEDYAQHLAENIGARRNFGRDMTWPNCCIDWTAAAEQLQMDYSSTEIQGKTYWYR